METGTDCCVKMSGLCWGDNDRNSKQTARNKSCLPPPGFQSSYRAPCRGSLIRWPGWPRRNLACRVPASASQEFGKVDLQLKDMLSSSQLSVTIILQLIRGQLSAAKGKDRKEVQRC